MYIKCSQESCKVINSVDKNALANHVRNGGKPVFACKGCRAKLSIAPIKASCSSADCRKTFGFYDFLLNANNPLVKCPHCQVLNKIKFSPLADATQV